jgi:nucleoside-diphosphate-sugar epimerase
MSPTDQSAPRLFCFGLGYCARRYIQMSNIATAGTVREAPRESTPGIRTYVFDPNDAALRTAIAQSERILVSIPPDREGDAVLRHFSDVIRPGASIVYLSSLGVYGDYEGALVTEESECRPQSARSRARLDAERAWEAHAQLTRARVAILRLAGIYGPGRNALVQVKDGVARRIVKPGQVFNRIHVDDIAQAIGAAFESPADGIFNIADDEPSPPGDPIAFAAQLLSVPPPPEIPFEEARRGMSPMALSFYAECRRADNRRMKSVLGVSLRYPTYREGLRALFAAREF